MPDSAPPDMPFTETESPGMRLSELMISRNQAGLAQWLAQEPEAAAAALLAARFASSDPFGHSSAAAPAAATLDHESLLKAVIQSSIDPIYVKDLGGRYLLANQALADQGVYEIADFIGRTDVDLYPPSAAKRFQQTDRQVLTTGLPVSYDNEFEPLVGITRKFLTTKFPWRDAQGNIQGVVGIGRDITSLKRAEAFLGGQRDVLERIVKGAPLEEVLQALVEMLERQVPGIPCALMLLDFEGKRFKTGAQVNLPANYVKMLEGAVIEEGMGCCSVAVLSKGSFATANIAAESACRRLVPFAAEHGLKACSATPVLDSRRNVIGTITVYPPDPTTGGEHLARVIEVATQLTATVVTHYRVNAEREETLLRLNGIADATNDLLWDRDLTNDSHWVNDAYYKFLGFERKPAGLRFEDWIPAVHPDDQERLKEGLQQAVDRGETEWTAEFRLRKADGDYASVFDRARILRNDKGRAVRVIGSTVDLTPHLELEQKFRQTQKMEAIGQLSGGIAHDFNNILAAIKLQAAVIETTHEVQPTTTKLLHEISAAADRGADLTRQLLMFSRQQAMQPKVHDLNQLVDGIAGMLRRLLSENIDMTVSTCPGQIQVRVDKTMIDQTLLNLAVNARDAMRDGGSLIIRTTTVDRTEDELPPGRGDVKPGRFARLSVRDNGEGIPPENRTRIFEPFFTTKKIGQGTGLGLATAYGVSHQHGGWIDLESELGVGTEFHVYLPLLARSASISPTAAAAPKHPVGNGETVLFVEDESAVRTVGVIALASHGYDVVAAASGDEALRLWQQHRARIALLVTDLIMPGELSGFRLAERIHADAPALPVIFSSGYSPDIARGSSGHTLVPGENYLPKPYSLEHLLGAVHRSIQSRCD